MKKLIVLVLLGMALSAGNAMAYLTLPDLAFDSTGNAAYTAADQKLHVVGGATQLTFDGLMDNTLFLSHIPRDIDDVNLYAEFVGMTGNVWNFKGDSTVSNSISIKGTVASDYLSLLPAGFDNSTGIMILGNITSLWFDPQISRIGGIFDITGGALKEYYANADYKGMFEINLERYIQAPTTVASNWQSASAKGDVSPVPEPASMMLLGTGFLGLIGVMRKRSK